MQTLIQKQSSSPKRQTSAFAPPSLVIQRKLAVNAPGDRYEQEADQIAERVMQSEDGAAPVMPQALHLPAVQRSCAECGENDQEQVRRKEAMPGQAGGQTAPPIVADVLASDGGRPLETDTRHFMESRFQHDFSRVRVHTGGRAANSARAVAAIAYTSGRHIVFDAGTYRPGDADGCRLIAHELAHVVQQDTSQLAPARVQRQIAPTPWTPPIRANETGPGRTDRLGNRTFDCGIFSVFIPAGAAAVTTNRVHVFFSPGDVSGGIGSNATAVHGLRSAADASQWILISVPGVLGGSNTISDADITSCLTAVGRTGTIDQVRLSAHSRGAAGLAATLQRRRITPALIDHVTVLDASDHATSLMAGLTASHVPASRVTAYNVVFGSLPLAGSQNIQLSFGCVRSIGYARIITDGLTTGRTPTPLPAGIASRVGALHLPARGNFSTVTPTPAGKTDLNGFCGDPANRAALIAMRDGEPTPAANILSAAQYTARASTSPYAFIEENNIMAFNTPGTPRSGWSHFSPQIYSHHLFVAEIGQEMFS